MSDILVFYKFSNYKADIKNNWHRPTPNFSSNQGALHTVVIGETAWLVTYRPERCWLVGQFFVTSKGYNESEHPYGRFRIEGDPWKSHLYSVGSVDITDVLYKMEFEPLNPIPKSAPPPRLPQYYIRSIRRLTPGDSGKLQSLI
jgi:hypothetical protein